MGNSTQAVARRSQMGQFFTPPSVARFMASLFSQTLQELRLLDPGAGVSILTAAVVEDALYRPHPPATISVVAYEAEPLLTDGDL